jgi:lipopolysaccharide/colanic/teichoic acid biosynthesis glycosyltransferase
VVLLFFWRQYFNKWAGKVFKISVVFLGASPEVLELKELFLKNPQLGYQTAGILAPDNVAELESLWRTEKFSMIVTAEKFDHSQKLTILLLEYLKKGMIINDLDKFYESVTFRVPISIIREAWFFENIVETERGVYEVIKRTFDIVLSLMLGILTIIVFPIVFIGIKIFDPGPAFYKQKRVGKNEKIFTLIKFRSMPVAKNIDEKMRKPTDKETTRFGKFIRKTHIDELPQVWNILKSEMSFIGPRPEKPEFAKQFSDEIPFYEMRQLIKPGLAGWAQLNNPNAGPSQKETLEKLQYDLYYIKNRSVFLDISIVLKTAKIMLSGTGK